MEDSIDPKKIILMVKAGYAGEMVPKLLPPNVMRRREYTFWDKGKAVPRADIEIERCGSLEMISTELAGGAIKGDTTDRRGGIFAERLCMPNGTSKDEGSRHNAVEFSMRRPRSLAVMSTTVTEFSAEDYIDASLSPPELSSLDTLRTINRNALLDPRAIRSTFG
jgi:hypothetical protein